MGSKDRRSKTQPPEIKLLDFLYGGWGDQNPLYYAIMTLLRLHSGVLLSQQRTSPQSLGKTFLLGTVTVDTCCAWALCSLGEHYNALLYHCLHNLSFYPHVIASVWLLEFVTLDHVLDTTPWGSYYVPSAYVHALEAQRNGLATRPKVDVVYLALQLFLEARISFRAHIPPNLVVTTRASHNSFDLSIRYPHHVSSARMASDRGMRHGARRQTDTSQPHPHRRFPR